jgi:hypothetical protein
MLTVSFFGRILPSSSSGPTPMAVRRGGRGGGIEPAGFVSGFCSSPFMRFAVMNNFGR